MTNWPISPSVGKKNAALIWKKDLWFLWHILAASCEGDQGGGCQILTSINAKFSWKWFEVVESQGCKSSLGKAFLAFSASFFWPWKRLLLEATLLFCFLDGKIGLFLKIFFLKEWGLEEFCWGLRSMCWWCEGYNHIRDRGKNENVGKCFSPYFPPFKGQHWPESFRPLFASFFAQVSSNLWPYFFR